MGQAQLRRKAASASAKGGAIWTLRREDSTGISGDPLDWQWTSPRKSGISPRHRRCDLCPNDRLFLAVPPPVHVRALGLISLSWGVGRSALLGLAAAWAVYRPGQTRYGGERLGIAGNHGYVHGVAGHSHRSCVPDAGSALRGSSRTVDVRGRRESHDLGIWMRLFWVTYRLERREAVLSPQCTGPESHESPRPDGPRDGFTLIAVAIIILVGTLLLAAYLPGAVRRCCPPIGGHTAKLAAVEQKMVGFMARNGRRPCPADGQYDVNNQYFGDRSGHPRHLHRRHARRAAVAGVQHRHHQRHHAGESRPSSRPPARMG